MTVIVGIPHKGHVYLGADSQSTGGSLARPSEMKVWKQGKLVFGLTGSMREQQLIQYGCELPTLPKSGGDLVRWLCTDLVSSLRAARNDAGYAEKGTDGIEIGPTCIVGAQGRLFVMYSDYQFCEYPDGAAVGSGEVVARGSLHTTLGMRMTPRRRIDFALGAACAHNAYCSGPYTYAKC